MLGDVYKKSYRYFIGTFMYLRYFKVFGGEGKNGGKRHIFKYWGLMFIH
jgi:hypothetical protein